MDYRKFYKQYYGINFGEEMAVHHCDFDRSNNDIDNFQCEMNKEAKEYQNRGESK